jgi:hypothetical protein
MHLGFCLYSDMVRSTHQEKMTIENIGDYSQFPSQEGMPFHAGPPGNHQGWSGGKRSKEKAWSRSFTGVFSEGTE